MKKLLLTALLIISAFTNAQTAIGYEYLNEVDFNHVQPFLSERLNMSLESEKATAQGDLKTFEYNYVDKVAINQEPERLSVTYTVFIFDGDFVVKDFAVSGTFERVLDFYVEYWDTTLKIKEAKPGEVVVNHYGTDRIAFSSNDLETATITIESSAYTSPEQYLAYWRD